MDVRIRLEEAVALSPDRGRDIRRQRLIPKVEALYMQRATMERAPARPPGMKPIRL